MLRSKLLEANKIESDLLSSVSMRIRVDLGSVLCCTVLYCTSSAVL